MPAVDNYKLASVGHAKMPMPQAKELQVNMKAELESKIADPQSNGSDVLSETSVSVAAPAAPVVIEPVKVDDGKKPKIPIGGRAILPHSPSPRTIAEVRGSLTSPGESAEPNRALACFIYL